MADIATIIIVIIVFSIAVLLMEIVFVYAIKLLRKMSERYSSKIRDILIFSLFFAAFVLLLFGPAYLIMTLMSG